MSTRTMYLIGTVCGFLSLACFTAALILWMLGE